MIGRDATGEAGRRLYRLFLVTNVILGAGITINGLAIANARIRPGEDLRALYDFASARIDFLERELDRNLSRPEKREAPPLDGHFASLGQFRFEKDGAGYILVGTEGHDNNILKIRPPLTFDRVAADRLVAALDQALGERAAQPRG